MSRPLWAAAAVAAAALLPSCNGEPAPSAEAKGARPAAASHGGSIAFTPDGARVVVVNADADSVSVIDARARALVREIALGERPSVDPATGRYEPSIEPRFLAVDPAGEVAYVTGHRSGALYRVRIEQGTSELVASLGSEPSGLVLSAGGEVAFVAVTGEGEIARVDLGSGTVERTAKAGPRPWALARSDDGQTVFATRLLGPGVAAFDAATLEPRGELPVADEPPRGDPRLYNGAVRGLLDVAPRPGGGELWVAHTLSSTTTAQPALGFETSVFPAISVVGEGGEPRARLSTDAIGVPGVDGAFADVVSGPRAIAMHPDGKHALLLDEASEDVVVIDVATRKQLSLLRPLPGDMPQGLALSPDGRLAAVDERNSADVAFLSLSPGSPGLDAKVDRAAVPRLLADPMPAELRSGQRLFFSANSDELPVTTNHWVACSSCHIEGRHDGVTWLFSAGPRETPSNAGGTLGTGLLLRSASRRSVQDYWRTFAVEQGGAFAEGDPRLDALAAFVNRAIPLPRPPRTDPARVARGWALFFDPAVGCAGCHGGEAFTDSGEASDLAGPLRLYDVGSCSTGSHPDVEHPADDGAMRPACSFDTPSLRGLADSGPYLHDGSAPTLRDALVKTKGTMGHVESLSGDAVDDLVEFLRSL